MTLDTYTGEKNGRDQPHGQGTMTYPDGRTYTGAWRDGQENGRGTMTWRDGDTYTGEWEDHERVP